MDEYDPSYLQRFTIPFDFNGTPTLSVPSGFNQDGLPLSLQFVGHPLREPLLCQVGQAYEQATDIMVENIQMDDARAGIDAFLAKRPMPKWKDR